MLNWYDRELSDFEESGTGLSHQIQGTVPVHEAELPSRGSASYSTSMCRVQCMELYVTVSD